jgi:hypothetical protein
MYQFKSKQISFTDFQTPIGMKLSPNNRWVKKAETIPWDEIEKRYAKLFTNRKGNVAKPLRLALGACINKLNMVIQMKKQHYKFKKQPICNISVDIQNIVMEYYHLTHL